MTRNSQRLIWLDMEMSGLNPEHDRILEVAVVVTEADLSIVAEGPVMVIHQDDSVLDGMDEWNQNHHGRSGLIQKVKDSTVTEQQAEQRLVEFLSQHVPKGVSPLCGNTVNQDRRFMFKYMPQLEAFFHYRTIDVSTLKELSKRWRPDVYKGIRKHGKHEALADVIESIEELAYYRDHFLVMQAPKDSNSHES
ncbi:oligoribonuclease [Brackiella oedipodis]|uniref:oligoribonuclease n=1 Tax=Brackiella oedipodis TaxID=124225 RepID=UPI00048C4EF0|nr:oligoribonuclease [Brackiella oedipodis]